MSAKSALAAGAANDVSLCPEPKVPEKPLPKPPPNPPARPPKPVVVVPPNPVAVFDVKEPNPDEGGLPFVDANVPNPEGFCAALPPNTLGFEAPAIAKGEGVDARAAKPELLKASVDVCVVSFADGSFFSEGSEEFGLMVEGWSIMEDEATAAGASYTQQVRRQE